MYSCDSSCKVKVFQTTLTGHVSIHKVFHKFFVSVAETFLHQKDRISLSNRLIFFY